MIHRATWWTGTALAVIAVGGTVGYWGYNQQQQRDAFASAATTQYQGAYHSLTADVTALRTAIADCLLTQDNQTLDAHLNDISRLAYAGQQELGKLPANFNGDYHLASYLHQIDDQARKWIKAGNLGANREVKKTLSRDYAASAIVTTQLSQLQKQIATQPAVWMDNTGKGVSSTMKDSLNRVDEAVGAIDVVTPKSNATANPMTNHSGESIKSAQNQVASLAGKNVTANWRTVFHRTGVDAPFYQVTGKTKQGNIVGDVSTSTGALLSYYNDRAVTNSVYDFSQASIDATRWLKQHGYPQVVRDHAAQYDHVAMFTFFPSVRQKPVIDRPIGMSVALDNGQIVGFHQSVGQIPSSAEVKPMTMTMRGLRAKLSPDFQVRMEQQVIVRNADQKWVSGVSFYGTLRDETYRVILDGTNGAEVKVEHLV